MVGILREHDEVARAVRSQYRHFVVDEYQDVNRLQQTLLELWLGERRDLCVVGDPAQTIYSFTGASPEHLLGFRTRHPEARTVELVRNYRSTPQVVGWPTSCCAAPGASAARLGRAAGPAPRRPGARAARRRQRPRRGGRPSPPASRPWSRRATRRPRWRCCSAPTARASPSSPRWPSAASPTCVRGGERFFSRKEVRDAIVLMRGAARSDDGSVPLPDLTRDVLLGAGWTRQAPDQRRCGP